MNHYNTLSLPYDADPEEIRSAYFTAVKGAHPDSVREHGHTQAFFSIQQAYDVLSNPERRSAYDLEIGLNKVEIPPIRVDINYSREALQQLKDPQLLYVWMEIKASGSADDIVRQPVHLCLVVDRSTSMAGERMDRIRRSILEALPFFAPDDLLSLVVFNDRPEVIIPPTRKPDPLMIGSRLLSISTGGGTEIYKGIKAGYDLLMEHPAPIRHLVLMTDGRTYGDEQASLLLATQAVEDGIRFSGLGFGSEWNDHFLDRLTSTTGGQAVFTTSTRELQILLTGQLQDSACAYARQMSLEINPAQGVELKEIFRINPHETPLIPQAVIQLGELPCSRSVQLLFELVLPPQLALADEFTLARCRLNLHLPGKIVHAHRVRFAMNRPVTREGIAGETPALLRRAVLRFNLYRMQEKARVQVREGKIEQATRQLRLLAAHLEQQGDQELARTALWEADQIEKTHAYSNSGEKRLKYGTRALVKTAITETF